MYEELVTYPPEELYQISEPAAEKLADAEEAREFILTVFKRVPELTEEQEKRLHKLGRSVRKRFGMKPVKPE